MEEKERVHTRKTDNEPDGGTESIQYNWQKKYDEYNHGDNWQKKYDKYNQMDNWQKKYDKYNHSEKWQDGSEDTFHERKRGNSQDKWQGSNENASQERKQGNSQSKWQEKKAFEQELKKELKKGRSMVWRITANRVLGNVVLFFSINFFLVLLFVCSVFYSEAIGAAKIFDSVSQRAELWAEEGPGAFAGDTEEGVAVRTLQEELSLPEGDLPRPVRHNVDIELQDVGTPMPGNGFELPRQITDFCGLPRGTYLSFNYMPGGMPGRERGFPYSISYVSMAFSSGLGVLPNWRLDTAVDLSTVISIFLTGFMILLAIELLMVFTGIFSAKKSSSKILKPINELTHAAFSINKEPTLQLSGTIDTLNTITEEHLDKRIPIADEREELRGLATAINGMLDRLDVAYQAQLRFVSDASHELRTPISVIQGYANLLDRWGKNDPKALQESIDAIKNEAEGMKGLVEQLLFLARSDNNTIAIKAETVDLAEIAREVEFETRMIDDSHEFTSDIDSELPVFGDEQLIKRALRIFVDNSIKYTPEGGSIRISAKKREGLAAVSVSDTGIGIPDEDISHVFDRFFRADESRARKSGGTGLGLSIARWIVERNGGYLEVVSRTDIGTKITAVFPMLSAAASISSGTSATISDATSPATNASTNASTSASTSSATNSAT